MRTFKDIDYLQPGLRPSRSDNRDIESLFALETPLRQAPDATSWTWTHLGLLFVASLIGVLLFSFVDDPLHQAVLLCASTIVFAYGIGVSTLLIPLIIPLAAGLCTRDVSLTAFLMPPACLLSFCDHFTRQHVLLQTTEPVSLTKATQLRTSTRLYRHYISYALFVFVALAISNEPSAMRPESYKRLSLASYYLVPRLAIAYLLLPPYDKLSALFSAFRSLFTYDLQGIAGNHPHVFRSPGGSVGFRLIPVYTLAVLLSGGLLFSIVPSSSGTTVATRSVEIVVLLLSFPDNLFALASPVLMLLGTTLLMTAPLLVGASRAARLAKGSDFDSYMERLETSR